MPTVVQPSLGFCGTGRKRALLTMSIHYDALNYLGVSVTLPILVGARSIFERPFLCLTVLDLDLEEIGAFCWSCVIAGLPADRRRSAAWFVAEGAMERAAAVRRIADGEACSTRLEDIRVGWPDGAARKSTTGVLRGESRAIVWSSGRVRWRQSSHWGFGVAENQRHRVAQAALCAPHGSMTPKRCT